MNNNLYHWHDERMVDLKMQEINRAVQQERLLQQAGLAGENWLVWAAGGLIRLLTRKFRDSAEVRPIGQESVQSPGREVLPKA